MREKLIEILNKSFEEQSAKRGILTTLHTADYLIANGVTIDPESLRQKGEWITKTFWKKRRGHHVQLVFKKCSLCNTRVKARWNNNFCPNCGADMRGESK